MFEKEQSSKQKLQEELDKLEKEYTAKLDVVQEKYDHVSEAESIVADFQAEGDLSAAKNVDTSNEVKLRFRLLFHSLYFARIC